MQMFRMFQSKQEEVQGLEFLILAFFFAKPLIFVNIFDKM